MLLRILTLIALLFAGIAQAQTNRLQGDDAVVDAYQAYKQGNRAKLAQLLPQVQGHPLEAWVAYWELRTRLDTAQPQEVQDFFTKYPGTYQEDRLRNDWLLLLGQRRDWDSFAANYAYYRMNDDREVRCYALLVSYLSGGPYSGEAVAEEVKRLWPLQRDADDGCALAASRLIDPQSGGLMKTDDAWRRARMAMEAGRDRAARQAVLMVAPDALPQFKELEASPSRFLTKGIAAFRKARKEMISLALIKLATSDLDHAVFQLDNKWGPQLSAEERNWLWGVMAKQAAQRLSIDALDLFAKVSRDKDLSDDMLAWKVRAALRSPRGPQWLLVVEAINAMSDEARTDPAWTYWKARALLATADGSRGGARKAEATKLLQSIASVRGFYEQLAMEELGQKVTVPARPAPLTPEEKEAARLNPGLNRALYAIALGIRPEGVREWNYTVGLHRYGGMSERESLAAAQFACDREVWDRCIHTSERTKTVFDVDQRFPMPYRDAVVKRAGDIGLDPAYVYGLIRQESRFVTDARSGVGAAGLMQIMPATARWTARKLGIEGFSPMQLHDRDTNIAVGTGYLKLVLDDFNGSMPLAAAAYNAGPTRPRAWRNGPVTEAAIWAENVPFAETRDYVKKVLANTTMYAAILTGQPQSLKARLGYVGPRDTSMPEPNKDIP
ncbi:MAG TPA: transglycosylase SLT domain-containing protein [Ramlibacter sp.]|nr:transglycosylase SLT domain-containing protein [Ramlibacter sp.]